MTEPNIPNIIAAAIAAAGPKTGSEAAWKAKINELIPSIVSMMGDGSRQTRIAREVLEASVFVAEFVRYEVEESSTRCVVWLNSGRPSRNYPDGIEPIRSHRTDNAQGRAMQAKLDELQPGDEIVVWKALEEAGDNKVRVLVHLEKRPGRTDKPAPRPDTPQPTHALAREPKPQPSESPVAKRFEELPSRVKARVAQRARAEGIDVVNTHADHVDKFIKIILDEETKLM